MSGIDFFVDTNILLYIMDGRPELSAVSQFSHAISVITEVELLGKKDITPSEVITIRSLLNNCSIASFNDTIKDIAISIKQKYTVKIPDAIIVATAKFYELPLVTADMDLKKIKGVDIVILDLKN